MLKEGIEIDRAANPEELRSCSNVCPCWCAFLGTGCSSYNSSPTTRIKRSGKGMAPMMRRVFAKGLFAFVMFVLLSASQSCFHYFAEMTFCVPSSHVPNSEFARGYFSSTSIMSEFWVSHKKYYCTYCKIYISDDAPSKAQHENGLRHIGNKERFVRNLYKTSEKKKHDQEEEKREIARIDQVPLFFSQRVVVAYG